MCIFANKCLFRCAFCFFERIGYQKMKTGIRFNLDKPSIGNFSISMKNIGANTSLNSNLISLPLYLVSVHNVRYLRYARPKIAHLRQVNSAFLVIACLDLEHSEPDT